MSHFQGAIDEVRISRSARYTGERFEPERRFTSDDETALLLHMDAALGPWVFDSSKHRSHPSRVGAPQVGP